MATTTYPQGNALDAERARAAKGNAFIYAASGILILSSFLKAAQLPNVVAFMTSLGYTGGTYFLIAALEFSSAVLFLAPATRRIGLGLVSAFLGGAIAGHLAAHAPVTAGPILYFTTSHPYVGALAPAAVLVSAWVGAWRDPATFGSGGHASATPG